MLHLSRVACVSFAGAAVGLLVAQTSVLAAGQGASAAPAAPTAPAAPAANACAPQNACAAGGWLDRAVPNAWGRAHFDAACDALGACYASPSASKRTCDDDFRAALLNACATAFPHRPQNAADIDGYAACQSLADRYRGAAATDAGDHTFDDAQACVARAAPAGSAPPSTVEQQPGALVSDRPASVVIRARDASGQELAGVVEIDGARVGTTGRSFTYTPRLLVLMDGPHKILEEPTISVVVPGHGRATRMLDMQRPTLLVRALPAVDVLTPGPHPVIVSAFDAGTSRPVQGTVTMRGSPVGQTNAPFSFTVHAGSPEVASFVAARPGLVDPKRCPDLWVVADGYADTPAGGNDCLK